MATQRVRTRVIGSLVRINEAKAALFAFEQIDRNKVLTAARWRKTGCSFFPVIVTFRGHLFSRLIIDADRNFLCRFRRANGEPILVSCVQVYRDQGMIMRFDGPTPMSVSDFETVV